MDGSSADSQHIGSGAIAHIHRSICDQEFSCSNIEIVIDEQIVACQGVFSFTQGYVVISTTTRIEIVCIIFRSTITF